MENWVFLRDTKVHSLFVHPSEHRAYGVLGLNDRIRDIVGGVVIETGLVQPGFRSRGFKEKNWRVNLAV